VRIREAVIHRIEAGGGAAGAIGELGGGGFAGENQEAVEGHAGGEINENVDPIGADEIGGALAGEGRDANAECDKMLHPPGSVLVIRQDDGDGAKRLHGAGSRRSSPLACATYALYTVVNNA
jgi:hypothetical protein